MKETYKCEICKKSHKIFKAIKAPAPEMILKILDAQQEERLKKI